jgi:CxxC motif-containing protein (DUF1111 family)
MRFLRSFALAWAATFLALPVALTQSSEAPTGFDDETNGFVSQQQFDQDKDVFEEREGNDDGLGPVYNAQSCAECHQTPVTGGSSQINEMRAGHFDFRFGFREHPGGSLIHDRAIDAGWQESIAPGNEVRTFRASLSVLGDGFIEAIADETLINIAKSQPFGMRGEFIKVPLFEAPGKFRVGRFGWKDQQASLLSFAADAYLNEMGITSPLAPTDNTSNGTVVDDGIADPEDDGEDLEVFARFMRSTKAPPVDAARAATPEAQDGSRLFDVVGCGICHVRTIVTAPPGTVINGGAFTVPEALGEKVIHPFSDFALHDVGTGDGIVQNGAPSTRNKVRTPPLWGVRSRGRLMHDGLSVDMNDAILRHGGEARLVTLRYRLLPNGATRRLLAFLASL